MRIAHKMMELYRRSNRPHGKWLSHGDVIKPPAQFFNRPIDKLIAEIGTTPAGLSTPEAARRLQISRTVVVKQPKAWGQWLRRSANPLVIVLLIASALSAAAGDVASFIIVVTIVVVSTLMDFVQERRAQNTMNALREKVALRVRVMRDGKEAVLSADEIVRGDIVNLAAGDLVPADGRLITAQDFFVNEALLTGEPYPVEKNACETTQAIAEAPSAINAAFAGTTVISGTATILVCQTGQQTRLGELGETLTTKPPATAFEISLQKFSSFILRVTGFLVICILAESIAFQRPWLETLMFALALAVGLTPELLPMIVTVTLARGAVRLARERVVIKRLSAIHDLGSMDVLCTDKTGTLTESKIKLLRHIDSSGSESEDVFELAYLNSHFETGLKSPLDEAIIAHGGMDISMWQKIDEAPFDFARRRVSVLLERDCERLLIVKGAPETILSLCAAIKGPDGKAELLTKTVKTALTEQFEQLGNDGFRVLAVASRQVAADHSTARTDDADLVFAGFAVFLDPPKLSALEAVRGLSEAGVAIKILTGDNERVASHLWASLTLSPGRIITGEQLSGMSEEALTRRLPEIELFCRVTPEQKLRIILALKRTNKTVGYLGDGINDAPALHSADVSISVDNAADVAKAAADIVLLDKDLMVLRDGIIEGRRTVINVDKYIRMAISANFGNILSMAIAGLILPFLPLLPVQVLLTNLLYDFAQLGLPFDYIDQESAQKPVHWNLQAIKRFMLVMGPISTFFDMITFAALVFVFRAGEAEFRTGWFIESLLTQVLMIFAVRTYRHVFKSMPHPLVTALALTISCVTIALPFLPVGAWFEFVKPSSLYFVFLLLTVVGFLIAVEYVKRRIYS